MNPNQRWKIIVCLLLVALSGAVAGGLATRWWMTQYAPHVDAASISASRLQRVLNLDAAQTVQVRGMFERWLVATEALAPGDIESRVRLRRQFLPELGKLLTPEQRVGFEALVAPNRESTAPAGGPTR
jgi:hypothetical protein